jgi:hypothetical protein
MNCVNYDVSNIEEALVLCSEFTNQYGVSVHEDKVIGAYIEKKYLNELSQIMDRKGFCLRYFEAHGKEVLVEFSPRRDKS